MTYRLDVGLWNQVFAVPCALVDRHLKLAGKEQLQAILWVLRNPGQPFSVEALAAALGMSAGQAAEALEYWCDRGLLCAAGELLSPVPQPEAAPARPAIPAPPQPPQPVPPAEPQPATAPPAAPAPEPSALPPKKRLIRPDGQHLAARLAESAAVRFLLQEAETTLGKTLSPAMSAELLAITDDYGLPPEVTVMLLQYAAGVGRTGTSYIDSVARDWAESGIFSVEAAEAKLQALTRERQAWAKVTAAAGLDRRAPSKSEGERALRWVWEWKFSDEMLAAAYDACAEHAGKFSAAYMDKVLARWHSQGIRTPAEARQEKERRQAAQDAGATAGKSYDIDELSRLSSLNVVDDL
ncbi:DnaD domain protein [Acutalibacter caecimuris]|uniref:DnaD domain protein n=1 Tax=Acutalibacter caecimuris TaxID=3093657 RepID=UPI002AC911A0|nr:DnaD domain protein [Acutalibacter sp. M00118]